jgi:hypothetical protein
MLRPAEKHEREIVHRVIANAFSMDTGWSDIQRMFAAVLLRNVHAGFEANPPDCVAIQHGSRIIAASVVNSEELAGGGCPILRLRKG